MYHKKQESQTLEIVALDGDQRSRFPALVAREASLGSDLVFGFHNGPAKQQTNHFGKADLWPLAQYDH